MAVDLFEIVCEKLEQSTELSRLEARGTVRIMLKEAGLNAKRISPDEMRAAVEQMAPRYLESRGVEHVEKVCAGVIQELDRVQTDMADPSQAVESIFGRLGS